MQQITEHTDVSQLNYVPSKMNPADYVSRGLTGLNKKYLHRWFNGSEFLWKSEFQWPRENPVEEIQGDDPEVKREIKFHTISWKRMRRAVTWILKYKTILSPRVRQNYVKVLPTRGLDVS